MIPLVAMATIGALYLGMSYNSQPADSQSDLVLSMEPKGIDTDKVAAVIHERVNTLRDTKHVQTLTYSKSAEAVALAHSKDMAERGYFEHDTPEGIGPTERGQRMNSECMIIGENLAQTYYSGTDETALGNHIFDQWYNSQGHYLNMYSYQYSQEGIGVYIHNGDVYATQNFC